MAREHAVADRRLLTPARRRTCRRCARRRRTAWTCGCWCRARRDIPLLRPFSRAGYRPLLEAGVRVFEWNGSMLHAKTAVADGRWARVGSTNLNIASWMGNRELDVIVEDEAFAGEMEADVLRPIWRTRPRSSSTRSNRVRAARSAKARVAAAAAAAAGRVVAGAVRIGNTVCAAITNRRVLEPVEAHIALISGLVVGALAILAFAFPRAISYPLGGLGAWIALALVYRSVALRRGK